MINRRNINQNYLKILYVDHIRSQISNPDSSFANKLSGFFVTLIKKNKNMSGWIKLHRNIQDHWIFSEPKYYYWWSVIILNANHKDVKMPLGCKLHLIKKGQCAYSIRTWSNKLKCSTKQVSNFFRMLENDGMIKKSVLGTGKQSTTLIDITNYCKYQQATETQEKHKRNESGTQGKREGGTSKEDNTNVLSKELKELKEERAYDFLKNKNPALVESFEMKCRKSLKGEFEDMVNAFNNQFDIEGIEYTSKKILARLENYKNSWIRNINKTENKNKSDYGANGRIAI